MNKLFFSVLIVVAPFQASGQSGDELIAAAVTRERLRINTERVALEAAFDAEEAACHQNFFVNRCLNTVKPKRREAMGQLRQQEVALNESERRQKAAEQMRKTEEKSSAEAQQEAAERRAQALDDAREREERTRQKTGERTILQQNEASNAAETANKARASQEKNQARADQQAAAAEERKKFQAKQQEVMERKAENEKRQREQSKPAAKPLPTPTAPK